MPNSAPTNNQIGGAQLTETSVLIGTSSTSVLQWHGGRDFLLLVNDSTATIYISLAGNTASLNAGVRLNANGGSLLLDRYVPVTAINAIATASSSNLLVVEG